MAVKKGSGSYRVAADGKSALIRSNKELDLLKRKVDPKVVRWTVAHRDFRNKNVDVSRLNAEVVKVSKNTRGYANLPGQLVKENK